MPVNCRPYAIPNFTSLQVIEVITATTDDSNPLNLDVFQKSNLPASWRIVGADASIENSSIFEVGIV